MRQGAPFGAPERHGQPQTKSPAVASGAFRSKFTCTTRNTLQSGNTAVKWVNRGLVKKWACCPWDGWPAERLFRQQLGWLGSRGRRFWGRIIRPGHASSSRQANDPARDELPDRRMIGGKAFAIASHAADADGDLPRMDEAALPGVKVRRKTPAAEKAVKERPVADHANAPGRHVSQGLLPIRYNDCLVPGAGLRFDTGRLICGHRKHLAILAFLARRGGFCAMVIFFGTVSRDFANRYSHPPFDAEFAFF